MESPSFNFRGQFALVFRFSADVYWTRDPANRGRSDLDSGLHEAGSLFGLDELFKAEGLDIQSLRRCGILTEHSAGPSARLLQAKRVRR